MLETSLGATPKRNLEATTMISINASELAALKGIQAIFEYQKTLNLSDTELAYELGISEHSIKCYRLTTKNKRYPSESVVKLAKLKLKLWEQGIKLDVY